MTAYLKNKKNHNWFHVLIGVQEGCMLLPLLFLLVTDWVMQMATHGIWLVSHGKQKCLKDLDFVNDTSVIRKTETL